MKVYLAAPFGEPKSEKRNNAENALRILRDKGCDIYAPWEHIIPHAWEYPNTEWGLMVFTNDISAIDDANVVVMLSYGRDSTAGTNWEAGYAFAKGKIVIVVEMTENIMSLMVANGRYSTVIGLNGLYNYDFEKMPVLRSSTEQK